MMPRARQKKLADLPDKHFRDDNGKVIEGDVLDSVIQQIKEGDPSPYFALYSGNSDLGSVGFRTIAPSGSSLLPENIESGKWYWPVDKVGDSYINYHLPRYRNLRDAIIVSLKRHPEAAYVVTSNVRGFSGEIAFKVSDHGFFEYPEDLLRKGTMKRWWYRYVKDILQPDTDPVHWKGSDDPMD